MSLETEKQQIFSYSLVLVSFLFALYFFFSSFFSFVSLPIFPLFRHFSNLSGSVDEHVFLSGAVNVYNNHRRRSWVSTCTV